jgi:NitT/TauT family transport system substrate-binding protein
LNFKNFVKIISVLFVLALAFGLSACKSRKQGALSLKLAFFPEQIKASLTNTAYQMGYFKEEGLDVEIEKLQSAADALVALELGKVDITPLGITQQLQFISQGSDLVIFGGSAQEGGAVITTRERAEEFAELNQNWRNVKWATGRSFTGDFVVRNQLRVIGIIPGKDIEIIDLGDNLPIIEAVKKGIADVGYITSDGVAIAESMDLSIGIRVGDLSPYYPCCRQTANGKSFREKRDALVAYQRALIRAYKVIQSDREKAIQIMRESTKQNREYVETGLYGKYASRYNPSPATKKVEEYFGFLAQEGVVANTNFKIADKVDSGIFKEALAQILERFPNDKDYIALKAFSDENDI